MTKILIIDDVDTTRLMDNIFSEVGYEVHAINNSPLQFSKQCNPARSLCRRSNDAWN